MDKTLWAYSILKLLSASKVSAYSLNCNSQENIHLLQISDSLSKFKHYIKKTSIKMGKRITHEHCLKSNYFLD